MVRKICTQLKSDSGFAQLQKSTGLNENDPGLRAEYAATKWLEVNRPDYRTVVSEVLEGLKKEVIASRDVILNKPTS